MAILSENRFRLGIGVGWNTVEFDALGESFGDRGRRMTEQVDFLRRLWSEDAFSFEGEFHRMELASILPRPSRPIPIMMGGSAPAALERCALHGDGWIPLGGPGEKAERYIASLRAHREAAGLSMDGFTIHAQAQYVGGDVDRWRGHAERWGALGATHLAVATHNSGPTDVDGHLARFVEYRDAVAGIVEPVEH